MHPNIEVLIPRHRNHSLSGCKHANKSIKNKVKICLFNAVGDALIKQRQVQKKQR